MLRLVCFLWIGIFYTNIAASQADSTDTVVQRTFYAEAGFVFPNFSGELESPSVEVSKQNPYLMNAFSADGGMEIRLLSIKSFKKHPRLSFVSRLGVHLLRGRYQLRRQSGAYAYSTDRIATFSEVDCKLLYIAYQFGLSYQIRRGLYAEFSPEIAVSVLNRASGEGERYLYDSEGLSTNRREFKSFDVDSDNDFVGLQLSGAVKLRQHLRLGNLNSYIYLSYQPSLTKLFYPTNFKTNRLALGMGFLIGTQKIVSPVIE